MALTRVELEQFTAFASLKLDLSRGINVLIGANGTGKTHLMKVCYAACDVSRSPADDFAQKLVRVFMPSGRSLRRLVRQHGGADGEAAIRVWRGALKLEASFTNPPRPVSLDPSTFTDDDPDREMEEWAREPLECVYVPVKEMLSNGSGFRSLYSKREVHFEEVYFDILDRAYLPALRGSVDSLRADKPVHYLVLIALDTLDDAQLANRRAALERDLPSRGPQGPGRRPWVRPIVSFCGVFNISSWNRNFPKYRVRRAAVPTRGG